MLSACHPVSRLGCWSLLIAANAGQTPRTRQFMIASVDQSVFQLCPIKETISSLDYTVWFDLNDGIRGNMFVCATCRSSWPTDTLVSMTDSLIFRKSMIRSRGEMSNKRKYCTAMRCTPSAYFPSLLVTTYLAYNVPIFLVPRNTL